METEIYNIDGKEIGKIVLPSLFDTKISKALLHEVVTGLLSNQRSGTHCTKTRGEVSGGGKKPWKEKGTGNARAGSIRSPLWRKGGIIFGPRPHGYYQKLSQQKRRISLQMVLSAKVQEGNIILLDKIEINEAKTKKMVEILKTLKVDNLNIIICLDQMDSKLKIACNNLKNVVLVEAKNLNTYQAMWANKIIIIKNAVEQLNKLSIDTVK